MCDYGTNKGILDPRQSKLAIGAPTDLMEYDLIHGQTEITKEMKVSYNPSVLVNISSPMGRRTQIMRIPSPTGLDIALKV